MTIIGLSGQKRAGKDTAASVLVEDYSFTRLAFADKLKEMALVANPLLQLGVRGGLHRLADLVGQIGWERAKNYTAVREYLQNFGVMKRDTVDPDYWVDTVVEQIELSDPRTNFVITDVRFPNEIAAVRGLGGYFVVVNRPGLDDSDQHVSETAWRGTEPDYALFNSGTLGDLRHAVVDMMASLQPRARG